LKLELLQAQEDFGAMYDAMSGIQARLVNLTTENQTLQAALTECDKRGRSSSSTEGISHRSPAVALSSSATQQEQGQY
jgi:hypothetical protein